MYLKQSFLDIDQFCAIILLAIYSFCNVNVISLSDTFNHDGSSMAFSGLKRYGLGEACEFVMQTMKEPQILL